MTMRGNRPEPMLTRLRALLKRPSQQTAAPWRDFGNILAVIFIACIAVTAYLVVMHR